MSRWRPDVTAAVASIALMVGVVLLSLGFGGAFNRTKPAPAVLPSGQALAPAPGGAVRTFDLKAAPATLELRPGLTTPVWAYNGTVPGPELRVTAGDLVRVKFSNQLPQATTLHWHGVSLPNGEDGVAGVTQDPVAPGQSVTYAFVVSQPGTYWYHSHQRSAEQVGQGLYGALVVEPRDAPQPVLDKVLIYSEWPLGTPQATPPPGDDASMARYGVYSVNGRSGDGIQPLTFKAGQTVRLRLVNAGFLTHYLHIHGAPFTITGFDGAEVTGGPPVEGVISLAAGERVELQFVAPDAPVAIHAHDPSAPASQLRLPMVPIGTAVPAVIPGEDDSISGQVIDLYNYPARAADPVWPTGTSPNRSFTLNLSAVMGHARSDAQGMLGMGGGENTFAINGRSFPDTATLEVAKGDRVEITFANSDVLEHSMHLHGQAFQLLAVNGRPLAGSLVKDTVDVLPGQSVTVGFLASNPGWWMLHCHELHHAAGGLDTLIHYQGAPRLAYLGGAYEGSPE